MYESSGPENFRDGLGDLLSAGHIATAADVATVLAAVGALIAAVIALRQLRSQAESQNLTAILATNDLWRDVVNAQQEVVLRRVTVARIIDLYADLGTGSTSALEGGGNSPVSAKVPYVLGALFPTGCLDAAAAPRTSRAYNHDLLNRTLAFGYVLNHLRSPRDADDEVPDESVEDAGAIERAMEQWVNKLNEIAELYGHGVINRRLFIGKRHIAVAQQAFFAEPYILWRNSTHSGRWGMRLVALGQEARFFHWRDELQTTPVMARIDPEGYEPSANYEGFRFRVGWMFGDSTDERRSLSRHFSLGSAFKMKNRRAQNALVREVPRDARLVTEPQGKIKTWDAVTQTDVLNAVKSLNRA